MEFNLDHLRTLLKDVPQPTSFTQSVQLLEDAFDYSGRWNEKPRWDWYRQGDDLSFFGERTLRALLGNAFREQLAGRKDFDGSDAREGIASARLRLGMQRYVVVGCRDDWAGTHAAYVLFHAGKVSFGDGSGGPFSDKIRPMELVRVRAGLMNRRQAHLLANHLNRFRRNSKHTERLTWSVVRGPMPNTSARDWFDAIAEQGLHLRHTVGELPTWGFGPNAAESIAMYAVESRRSAHREQVFAYGAPRYLLPPRFGISATEKVRSYGVPEGQQWDVVRMGECPLARAIADACEKGGLIHGEECITLATPANFWGQLQDGHPNDGPGCTPSPAEVYATSFSGDEAARVMKALREAGYGGIRAYLVGPDGNYVRQESGNPYFYRQEVHNCRKLEIAGGPELAVRLQTFFMVRERHTLWEDRQEWEREALTALQKQEEEGLAMLNKVPAAENSTLV